MEPQLRPPGDWHRRTHQELDADDLESVLIWLQEIEINGWIQTTAPAYIAAGLYDPAGTEDIWTVFHAAGGVWPNGEIARWLVDTARFHYPRARL